MKLENLKAVYLPILKLHRDQLFSFWLNYSKQLSLFIVSSLFQDLEHIFVKN